MAEQSNKVYIPPFSGIQMIECRDHLLLVAMPAVRIFYGFGKVKASEAVIELETGKSEPFWADCSPDEECYAVVQWARFDDGHEEKSAPICYMRLPCTEEDARREAGKIEEFYSMSRQKALALLDLVNLTEEEREEELHFIENNFPNFQSKPSDSKSSEYTLYQARLKVLAGMQPKTVALMQQASEAKDAGQRQKLEREAVQAYFAEVATYWSDDMLMAWQRNNPVGFKWICEFARNIEEPERQLDRINHELVLNWIRRGYNLMTENELSDAILITTGQRLIPNTLKKKRDKLGLSTKRPRGPRPNSEK